MVFRFTYPNGIWGESRETSYKKQLPRQSNLLNKYFNKYKIYDSPSSFFVYFLLTKNGHNMLKAPAIKCGRDCNRLSRTRSGSAGDQALKPFHLGVSSGNKLNLAYHYHEVQKLECR